MPVGNGGAGIAAMGRSLETMVHLKKSIFEVKSEENFLAHALVIAIARLINNANYVAYRKGRYFCSG
jgi:hypothetical protein